MQNLVVVLGILIVGPWVAPSHGAESKSNCQAESEQTVQVAKKEGGKHG